MKRPVARLGSLALGIAAIWLVALHALFLWRRLADATIHQPGILVRWIASIVLIAAALTARHYVTRRWRRRHTTAVFWFLVLLLHVSIPAEERLLGSQETLLVMTQTGVVAVTGLLAIAALSVATGILPLIPSAIPPASHAFFAGFASLASPRAPPCV